MTPDISFIFGPLIFFPFRLELEMMGVKEEGGGGREGGAGGSGGEGGRGEQEEQMHDGQLEVEWRLELGKMEVGVGRRLE